MTKLFKPINKNNKYLSYNGIVLSSFKYFARDRTRKHRMSFVTKGIMSLVVFDLEGRIEMYSEVDKKVTEWIMSNKNKFFKSLFNDNLRWESDFT